MCKKKKNSEEYEEFEKDIDVDATFAFPQPMTEHNILGKHLIIAPENANWLVCDDEEYEAFCFFRDGKNIQEVEQILVKKWQIDGGQVEEIIFRLIAQILGKEFLRDATIREKSLFKAATLNLTEGCNLRCATCLWNATVAGSDECSLNDWIKFIGAFKDYGGQLITLTGGEPMMNPDCLQIMQNAKRLSLNVVLLTNGMLVTKENAQIIGENCGEVRISIDGPDEETNDSVRGKGTFVKAVSAIRELSIYPQCCPSITMTPTPATLHSFRAKLRHFSEWIRKTISPDITFRVTRELENGRDLPLMSRLERLMFQGEIIDMCNDQLGKDYTHKVDAAGLIPNRRIFGCGVAELFTVRANGDIKLCAYAPDPFGNIKDMKDGSVFLCELTEKLGQLIRANRVEMIYPCNNCDLRFFCGGKCRKENNTNCDDFAVCECSQLYRTEWYERLVNINQFVVEPIINRKEET